MAVFKSLIWLICFEYFVAAASYGNPLLYVLGTNRNDNLRLIANKSIFDIERHLDFFLFENLNSGICIPY